MSVQAPVTTAPAPASPSVTVTASTVTSWTTAATTLATDAAAVVAVVYPGHPIPVAVQSVLVVVAGMLTALHLHVPRLVGKIFARAL